jgi:hypothetical protein
MTLEMPEIDSKGKSAPKYTRDFSRHPDTGALLLARYSDFSNWKLAKIIAPPPPPPPPPPIVSATVHDDSEFANISCKYISFFTQRVSKDADVNESKFVSNIDVLFAL